MELLANKFSVIVTSMKKKPYDFLDQRKAEFDQDFDDFKRQISDLHVSIMGICVSHKLLFLYVYLWLMNSVPVSCFQQCETMLPTLYLMS